MKKTMILGMLMAVSMSMQAKQVTIQTKNTTMVLEVENGKQPQYVYYGAKLSDYDLAQWPHGCLSSLWHELSC